VWLPRVKIDRSSVVSLSPSTSVCSKTDPQIVGKFRSVGVVWSGMSINGLSSYTARTQVGISGQHLCAIFSSGSKIATVMEPFEFSNGGMLRA